MRLVEVNNYNNNWLSLFKKEQEILANIPRLAASLGHKRLFLSNTCPFVGHKSIYELSWEQQASKVIRYGAFKDSNSSKNCDFRLFFKRKYSKMAF